MANKLEQLKTMEWNEQGYSNSYRKGAEQVMGWFYVCEYKQMFAMFNI